MTVNDYIKLLDRNGGVPTSTILNNLISENKGNAERYLSLWNQYRGDVPIKKRTFVDATKLNNKLSNDYRGIIIKQAVGYLFSNPLSYQVKKDVDNYDNVYDELQTFLKRNNYSDMDADIGELSSVCGLAYRLLYIDKSGKERMMNIKPWEAITLYDTSTDEMRYAMIYYTISTFDSKGKEIKKTKIEWYTNDKVYFFISDDDKSYVPYLEDGKAVINHLFNYVPVIKFSNNGIEKGDFENVTSLIDAYDKTISDSQNELEEFRMAYMKMKGYEADAETILKARQTGAFIIPENGDIDFITKEVNVEALKLQLDTLNKNIYLFAESIDFSDDKFSGGVQTGVSRQWKMLDLINRMKTKQRKFERGINDMFKILTTSWEKRNVEVDYYDITVAWSRETPIDLDIQSIIMLRSLVSDDTLRSQLSFIPDVDVEGDKIKQQNEDNEIDLDNVETDNDN